ncbi:MAG: putative zinc-binding protein [Planctomycetota bacterium]
MKKKDVCACAGVPSLVFSCSGASDVGAIADQAARRLSREGEAKMYCLAGIGGRVPGIMKTTEAAPRILAIDGCPIGCAKECLERAGFKRFRHFTLSDVGLEKGRSPMRRESVRKVAQHAARVLAGKSRA